MYEYTDVNGGGRFWTDPLVGRRWFVPPGYDASTSPWHPDNPVFNGSWGYTPVEAQFRGAADIPLDVLRAAGFSSVNQVQGAWGIPTEPVELTQIAPTPVIVGRQTIVVDTREQLNGALAVGGVIGPLASTTVPRSAGEGYVVTAAGMMPAHHWTVSIDGTRGRTFPVRVVLDGRGRFVNDERELDEALAAGGRIDDTAIVDERDVILTAVPRTTAPVQQIGPGLEGNTENPGLLYAGIGVAALVFLLGRKRRS